MPAYDKSCLDLGVINLTARRAKNIPWNNRFRARPTFKLPSEFGSNLLHSVKKFNQARVNGGSNYDSIQPEKVIERSTQELARMPGEPGNLRACCYSNNRVQCWDISMWAVLIGYMYHTASHIVHETLWERQHSQHGVQFDSLYFSVHMFLFVIWTCFMSDWINDLILFDLPGCLDQSHRGGLTNSL